MINKLLTDQQYHNTGVGMEAESPDIGRAKVSKAEKDTGACKTPTLRNITRTAPYFHDGSAATLREAIDFMIGGGFDNAYLDRENMKPVELSEAEIYDLIAFLEALECNNGSIERPALPE